MTTTIFKPDAHPEVSSVDGEARAGGTNELWTTLVNGNGTVGGESIATTIYLAINSATTSNRWTSLRRLFMSFDTSTIPSGTSISSAILDLYGIYKVDNLSCSAGFSANIYTASMAEAGEVYKWDYQTAGSTPLSDDVSYSSWDDSGFNTFTFNATGLAAINLGGRTDLCVRNSYDVADSAPNWVSNTNTALGIYTADQGTDYAPKLTITYSAILSGQIWVEDIVTTLSPEGYLWVEDTVTGLSVEGALWVD